MTLQCAYRRLAIAAGATAVSAAAAFAISLFIAPYAVEDYASVRVAWRGSDAWLLDRSGEMLSRVRMDKRQRRGDWLGADQVSPALIAAVLASEDRRFSEHRGVDWLGMLGAAKQTAGGGRRGGSTLTMQLAAYLHPQLETGGRRDLIDKWRQLRQALAIERAWNKQQILEAWLNYTPFRGEVEGVDAAARALLGKHANGVDHIEGALLAALVRAPNATWPQVARRACAVLDHEETACFAVKVMTANGLRAIRTRAQLDGDAPHLAHKLLTRPGERLTSTLDARVQRHAAETLERHLRELAGRNVEDGALVVLDNASGQVLAWIGSSGALSRAQDVDGVTAPRQAGSTLKPFLYALAIEKRLLTAASILDDSPLAITTPAGLYVPQNYDHSFKGQISLRQALASSLNVPAVRTLALIGYEPFHQRLKALGLATLTKDADHYGYALALGGADVSLLQLTNAYRAIANGGRLAPVQMKAGAGVVEPEAQAVVDPVAAYIVGDILADGAARALTFGLASPLATRYAASVKTGTSKDMRDNWAVGYTSRYTVGVWVGNFSGEPMHDVSGVSGAAPVWRDVMDFLHDGDVPAPAVPPPDAVRRRVVYDHAVEPARDEWFVSGTETSRITPLAVPAQRARMTAPADGAIYAIDPDIPRERQRIAITARGAGAGSRFVLDDGRRIRADAPFLWLPPSGKRQVTLVDRDGRELDRVKFEVRGVKGRQPGGQQVAMPAARGS